MDIATQENVGDVDFRWMAEYGTAWRIGGVLGEDILMLADPKALHHMFHKPGYDYVRSVEGEVLGRLINGRGGIVPARGSDHHRQRKALNPAFSIQQIRSFLPLFRKLSSKMCQQWKTQVLSGTPEGSVIKVNKWLGRLTLDILGQAAFDFNFGALDDDVNEISKAYHDMFLDSSLHPSVWNALFIATWPYLPTPLLDLVDYLPTREYSRYRHTINVINKVSKRLIDEKTQDVLKGDSSKKDAMSVLVRANFSEDPKSKLSEQEMLAQMSTLTLAGHETTASMLHWYLWELARNPHFQEKLREEVVAVRELITARGDTDLTMDDLDSLTYMQAGIKETLRMHPILYHLSRAAGKDDVLPLLYPIRTKTGEMISEIPLKAGQNIIVSIAAYNRIPELWGEDADVWDPTRFLNGEDDKEVKIGVYANVMTFSGGTRGCLGWRFSLVEMQAIVFDLIENFKFALPPEKVEIRRAPTGALMSPLVKDKAHEGSQMPLLVTPL